MNPQQRRIVLAVCLLVGLSLLVVAGLTFLVTPMAQALELTDDDVSNTLAVTSVASLAVVFSAAQLGDRIGRRRALIVASSVFSAGSMILVLASGPLIVQLGLALCAAAAITIQVLAVGLLQAAVVDGPAHISAFTTYGMVFPAVFLTVPVATAWLLGVADWHLVPLAWAVAGLVMVTVTMVFVRAEPARAAHREWLTPLLAGLSMAAVGHVLSEAGRPRTHDGYITWVVVGGVASGVACYILVRRRAAASFSLRILDPIVLRALLVGVALASFCGILTYVSLAFEFLYGMTALEAALAVAPAQLGGVLGARLLAERALLRWGGIRAGRMLLLMVAVTMLPLVIVQSVTPAWYLVVVATVFTFTGMAALTAFNAEVMRRAPLTLTSDMSAFRTSASSLGAALGVGIFGTLVLSSVSIDSADGGANSEQLAQLAGAIRLMGLIASLAALGGWLALTRVEPSASAHERV